MAAAKLQRLVDSLVEANPMLGHRGCRLGITYPEITEMQARAIFEAGCRVGARGQKVVAEVMIPLVAHVEELKRQAEIVRRVAQEVFLAEGRGVPYLVGTMIELPRAALTADEIAKEADFFSFGTNDLTQTTFGLSRDDAGRFLPFYVEHGILHDDPFQVLDQEGVGKLIEIAVRLGRGTRSDLKIGICGEHGGEPRSVKFCHHAGMNYVSCSPFRLPIARLAAALAGAMRHERTVRPRVSYRHAVHCAHPPRRRRSAHRRRRSRALLRKHLRLERSGPLRSAPQADRPRNCGGAPTRVPGR